ncbi:unnamed protein product [Allacma fusca]|uniref:XK-related protein n=1 Tax=Allacma fusca TaxID=39272 RepID=A0A8J2PIR3_9HEXA|nr:unnamed protein product [Allacma fusca]
MKFKQDSMDTAQEIPNGEDYLWQYDDVDALPESLRFNYFDIFCIFVSIATYFLDLGMDIYVACIYYKAQNIWYFVLTLVFVIIPAGTMTAFSLRWYVMDMDNQTNMKPSCTKWVIRTIFLLLQLAPVLRYIDSLIYGLKSRAAGKRNDKPEQKRYYNYMLLEDTDASLLRLFESFMEAAPQVTLQLYILIYHFWDEKAPFKSDTQRLYLVLAILTSLVSLAWSLSSYHRSVRFSQSDKLNISYKGVALQFVWHFCIISSRVFALGVFASTYPILLIPVCVAHLLAMLVWLVVQGNQDCANQCGEALLNLVVAFIYIFIFFNVRDEPTRYKYLTFYLICFLENTILLLTWFFSLTNVSTPEILWFRVSGIVGHYALFFLGILFMVLYYVYFHPSLQFRFKSSPSKKEYQPDVGPQQQSSSVKNLTRKGSVDLVTSNPHSATSSRKIVSFAPDVPKSQESISSSRADCDKVASKVMLLPKPEAVNANEETPL